MPIHGTAIVGRPVVVDDPGGGRHLQSGSEIGLTGIFDDPDDVLLDLFGFPFNIFPARED